MRQSNKLIAVFVSCLLIIISYSIYHAESLSMLYKLTAWCMSNICLFMSFLLFLSEGFECKALGGARRFLRQTFVPYIFMEWKRMFVSQNQAKSPCPTWAIQHLTDTLTKLGYTPYEIRTGFQLNPAISAIRWKIGDVYWRHCLAKVLQGSFWKGSHRQIGDKSLKIVSYLHKKVIFHMVHFILHIICNIASIKLNWNKIISPWESFISIDTQLKLDDNVTYQHISLCCPDIMT